jgi:hypothetical protein
MPRKRGRQRHSATERVAPTQPHCEEAGSSAFADLPQYQGPKLHIFEHHMFPIEWLERLDADRDGMQGYVFRAKINSTFYAIKVVSALFMALGLPRIKASLMSVVQAIRY